MRFERRGLAAALVGALALAGTAAAGTPGRWDVVARGGGVPGGSANDLGVVRTADGAAHVAWKEITGASTEDLRKRSVAQSGALGSASTIVSGWAGIGDPALVTEPGGGLRAFFGGIRTTTTGPENLGLFTATAPAPGTAWSSPIFLFDRNFAYARTISAAVASDGTAFQAWYGASEIYLHRGLSAGTPDQLFSAGSDLTEFGPGVAVDAAGRPWVSWCGFGGSSTPGGIYVQQADAASGAPVGTARQLPGSVTNYQGTPNSTCNLERTTARQTPIVARVGGGVYVAGSAGYPTLNRVLVWRIDELGRIPAGAFAVATGNFDHRTPVLAAAPDGRVWVAWIEQRGTGGVVLAKRSNRAGTAFGAPVAANAPAGWDLGAINISAQATRLDVFGLLSNVSNDHSIQHTQLLPGLTLVRSGITRRPRGRATVTFRVLDAGDPVAGARISAGGRSAVTPASGRVTFAYVAARPRSITATASRAGYVAASLRFRCC